MKKLVFLALSLFSLSSMACNMGVAKKVMEASETEVGETLACVQIQEVFAAIGVSLSKGNSVELDGFGTFQIESKQGLKGNSSVKYPGFQVAGGLKNFINEGDSLDISCNSDLVQQLVNQGIGSEQEACNSINLVLGALGKELKESKTVQVPGFGSFNLERRRMYQSVRLTPSNSLKAVVSK